MGFEESTRVGLVLAISEFILDGLADGLMLVVDVCVEAEGATEASIEG